MVPPVVVPPPPRRASGLPVWLWIVMGCGILFFCVVILAAVLLPVFMQARKTAITHSPTGYVHHIVSIESRMAEVDNRVGKLMDGYDKDPKVLQSVSWMKELERDGNEESALYQEFRHMNVPPSCAEANRKVDLLFHAMTDITPLFVQGMREKDKTKLLKASSLGKSLPKLEKDASEALRALPTQP